VLPLRSAPRWDPYTPPVLAYTVLPAPWGAIHVAASRTGLVALQLLTPTDAFLESVARLAGTTPEPLGPRTLPAIRDGLDRAAEAVEAALDGRPSGLAGLPIDLHVGSAWDRRVLEGVRAVPRGSVTSYGRLARLIGSPGAARAAGGAVGRNPIGLVIPCHRVIAGDGSLGGYGGDWWGGREQLLSIKRELLELEGVHLPATSFIG
jgi:O-6-methylguanine DNA methyltransferase